METRLADALKSFSRWLVSSWFVGLAVVVVLGVLIAAAWVLRPLLDAWARLAWFGVELTARFLLAILIVWFVTCVTLVGWLATQPSSRHAVSTRLRAVSDSADIATLALVAGLLGATVALYEAVASSGSSELRLVIAALGVVSAVLATALYAHVQRAGRLGSDIRQLRAELRVEVQAREDEVARLRGLLEIEGGAQQAVKSPLPDVDSVEFEIEGRARGLTDAEIGMVRAESHAARAGLEARLPDMARRIRRINQ